MKKTVLFLLVSLFTISFASAKDVVTTDMQRLPQPAREFIKQYFPSEQISYIKIDEEIMTTHYEVIFVSGAEIEFNKEGVWKEIDANRMEVPAAIIPAPIASYLKQNFPNTSVIKIEKKRYLYEVKLSNRLELEFDKDGNFVRIDD